MHRYAQTNVQLFNQLRACGYPLTDVQRVARTYEVAMQLFTGRYEPSGKIFIAHVVGTASILAGHGARAALVAAGLLHNAYWNGDFGDGKRGPSEERRRALRPRIDAEVEDYVQRFAVRRWFEQDLARICESLPQLDAADRDIVLLYLADQMEKQLDHEILYFTDGEHRRDRYLRELPWLAEMARRLDQPALAAALNDLGRDNATTEIPQALRRACTGRDSFVLLPSSARRKLSLALRSRLPRRWRRRARPPGPG